MKNNVIVNVSVSVRSLKLCTCMLHQQSITYSNQVDMVWGCMLVILIVVYPLLCLRVSLLLAKAYEGLRWPTKTCYYK